MSAAWRFRLTDRPFWYTLTCLKLWWEHYAALDEQAARPNFFPAAGKRAGKKTKSGMLFEIAAEMPAN
jgi:hypothetical protein